LSEFGRKGDEGRRAVVERGGFEQIVYNGNEGSIIVIEIQGSLRIRQRIISYRYHVELIGLAFGRLRISKENFSIQGLEKPLLEFPIENNLVIARDENGEQIANLGVAGDSLGLNIFEDINRYPILSKFSSEMQGWTFLNLLPPLMKKALQIKKELQLQTWGENLPIVLHALQTEYPDKFKEIEEILKSAVPELKDLTTGLTSHEPGRTYVRIAEKDLGLSIPAWGMSDGLLRLLGLLVTLYLPESLPLICIEEPENYVHPRLLELIVDLIKTASEKMQVLATTHSPYLVDLLQPEDLFIVEKKEGQTNVRKAEDKKGIKEALKTLGLGEIWYSGSLGGVP
jgi:predicted ATPase